MAVNYGHYDGRLKAVLMQRGPAGNALLRMGGVLSRTACWKGQHEEI